MILVREGKRERESNKYGDGRVMGCRRWIATRHAFYKYGISLYDM